MCGTARKAVGKEDTGKQKDNVKKGRVDNLGSF